MKKAALLVIAAFWINIAPAQDAKAKEILDKLAAKTQSYSTLSADFTVTLDNKKDKVKDSQTGKLILKDNMFKIKMRDSDIYSNGKQRWTYLKESNEVNLQNINPNDPNVLSNPSKLFNGYLNDFKYAYKGVKKEGGIDVLQVDLYPKNLKAAYSLIKLYINGSSGLPKSIAYSGKDGMTYTINFTKITPNLPISNSEFSFNERAYPGVEVIDLR